MCTQYKIQPGRLEPCKYNYEYRYNFTITL